MSRSKDGDPKRNLSALSDEELVALSCREEATSEEKDQIQSELQIRYYPHYRPHLDPTHEVDSQQEDRVKGHLFKKRVCAVLLASGVGREWIDECCEECCSYIFEKLFMDPPGFEDLLSKFDPQRSKSSHPFRYWVINVRVNAAVIDWLRKQGKDCLGSVSRDEAWLPEHEPSVEEGSPAEPQEEGPWMWWDGFLIPRHGTMIRLLHLAYLDLNDYYLKQVTSEANKAKGDGHTEVDLLQRRLRPAMRFGDSEAMEEYTLYRMLESEHLEGLGKDARIDEVILSLIISDAAQWANWRFDDRSLIDEKALKEMLFQALGEQSTVTDFRQVVRRWERFLEGELIEGTLQALAAEIMRWESRIRHDEKYLRNRGLDGREVVELAQSAEESTLGELGELQKTVTKGDERTRRSLAYQEHVLRLSKARRKRDKVLADYGSGKYLVAPLQREIADMLGWPMGTVGPRVAEAKRALSGAVIWRTTLAVLADLEMIARYQHRLDRLRRTCVVSFEGGTLEIGVSEAALVRWWNVLSPCVEAILQKPPAQGTVDRYGRPDMTVVVTNHAGEWPPLMPEWDDDALSLGTEASTGGSGNDR